MQISSFEIGAQIELLDFSWQHLHMRNRGTGQPIPETIPICQLRERRGTRLRRRRRSKKDDTGNGGSEATQFHHRSTWSRGTEAAAHV